MALAGYLTTVKLGGTPVALSAEPMTNTSGNIFQITDATRRVLDRDVVPNEAKPCELLICRPFENIDIVPEREVTKDDGATTEYTWKGGFIISRDISHSEDVSGLKKNNIRARTFYVERKQNVVGVCTLDPNIGPCIPP